VIDITELENFLYNEMRANEIKEMPMHIRRKVFDIFKPKLFLQMEKEIENRIKEESPHFFDDFVDIKDISFGNIK
jgi:hypothetical protein